MRKVKLLGSLLLAALLLYLLAQQVDARELARAWGELSARTVLFSCLVLVLDFGLRGLRWRIMLRELGSSVTTRRCLGPMLAGFALNNTLPLRAGDVARTFGFTTVLGLKADKIAGTLIIERLLDLFALCVFFLVGLGLAPSAIGLAAVTPVILAIAASVLILFLALIFAPEAVSRFISATFLRALPRSPGVAKLRQFIEQTLSALVALGRHATLFKLAIATVLIWSLEALVFFLIQFDIQGSSSVLPSMFSMATGTLGTLLPSTPGYVGTFDYFCSLGMQAYGAEPSAAVLATLAIHLVLWLPVTLAGTAYLLVKGRGDFKAYATESSND